MNKFQAMKGKVIVDVLEEENQTSSGLHIVRKSNKNPLRGHVMSVGRDRIAPKRTFKAPCKIGDVVHYKKGTSFQINSQFEKRKMSVIYFGDIVGVQRGEDLLASYDNVVVQVFYKDTSDTIIIPEVLQKRMASFVGNVTSVGPEYNERWDPTLNRGDIILFPRDEGFPIVIGDEAYYSLYPEHIKGKINQEDVGGLI